jgi:stage III sporulation protein AB
MEPLKLVGAGMILTTSAWAGIHAGVSLRRTYDCLRDLSSALELMTTEISFAGTPFLPLCRRAGEGRSRAVRNFFDCLAQETVRDNLPEDGLTRHACAEAGLVLPEQSLRSLERLFDGFGHIDRDGQLRQLTLASEEIGKLSAELREQLTGRCRTFATLGLTAGAAMLVLVL